MLVKTCCFCSGIEVLLSAHDVKVPYVVRLSTYDFIALPVVSFIIYSAHQMY